MSMEEWTAVISAAVSGALLVFKMARKHAVQCAATQRKLDTIVRDGQELHPNAGSSLRDAVNRIEGGMAMHSAQLQASFEAGGVQTFEADKAGMWTGAHGVFASDVGLALDEMNGTGWVNALTEGTRAAALSEWQSAVTTGRDIRFDVDLRHIDGGDVMPHRIHARRLTVNGSPAGYFGVIERHP